MVNSGSFSMGWFDKIKHKLQLSMIKEKIQASKGLILDCIVYFGLGFLLSFLLKRYGQYVLFFCITIFILHQLSIINVTVHWETIQQVIGLTPAPVVQGNIVMVFWEWVKLNVVVVLSFCIGCVVGLKVA